MTDLEFVQRFEAGDIAEDSFHHAEHVHLAFAYLSEYPVLAALDRFCTALKRFAAAHGKPQLYHETITFSCLFLIRERMARTQSAGWQEFAANNGDLLIWKNGILSHYYSDETLKSDLARTIFVFPNRFC